MSATPEEKRRGICSCRDERRDSDEKGTQDQKLHWVGDSPSDQGAADKNASKMSFFATNSPWWGRETRRSNTFHVPSIQLFIHKVLFRAQMNETEDYAQLRGSPGQQRLRSSSASARVILRSILFPEESLWTISGMPNSRELVGGGGVDYTENRNAPPNTVNNTDNQLSTNPTSTLPARLPAVPASSHAVSRPSHLIRSCARCVCLCVCLFRFDN